MCEFLQRHVYFMFYCCVMEKHFVFWNKDARFVIKLYTKTRTVQMALVGPRSNVVSPHGIVVDQSSRPYGTDIKISDYGEVLEAFF